MAGMGKLSCVKLPEWAILSSCVKDRGTDWWVSALADVDVDDIPRRMLTERVEGELVSEVFTHCFYQKSSNIKQTSDTLIDMYGLGLRRKKVRSHEVAGAVFVLVNKDGPTILQQMRETLSADSRKLSTEERLRRTHMTMDVCAIEHLVAEAKRRPCHFWLTSWSETCAEEGKKKAVAAQFAGLPNMEGQKVLATDFFDHCILSDVADCQKACVRVMSLCGSGYRKQAVRAKEVAGCVALFFTAGLPRLPLPGESAAPIAAPRSDSPPEKRRRTDAPAPTASCTPVLPIENSSVKAASVKSEPVKSQAVKSEPAYGGSDYKAVVAEDEEKRYNQVRLLEKRLSVMLPTMDKTKLSTDSVQAALEKQMQKPSGFLDTFKMDLARIWRSFKDTGRVRQ